MPLPARASWGYDMTVLANFEVVYLLPFLEMPTAAPDPAVPGMYRHTTKVRAAGELEIISQILGKGGTVISMKKERERRSMFHTVPKEYKRQLLQATTFSIQGGMSAGRALQAVIESETGPMRPVVEPALVVINAGGSCYEAIKAMDIYDETTLAIIESGELTGNIVDALETAAKHQEGRAAEQKIMFGAVSWTVLDILFSVSGILGNIWGLLPQAEASMHNVPADAAERVESAIRVAYVVNWTLLFGTVILISLFLYCLMGALSKSPRWRAGADRVMQSIPFFNQAVLQSAVAASCTVAQSLIRGGVSLITVSDIASRSTRNWKVQTFWANVREKLNQGESIARCFSGSDLFTHAERILLVSHTSREQLSDTCGVITVQRRARAETAAKRFSGFAFFASLLYSAISVVVTLWVSYLQYTAMMASNNSLGG